MSVFLTGPGRIDTSQDEMSHRGLRVRSGGTLLYALYSTHVSTRPTLVLSTRTSNGVRPKYQQCLLLFPFPPFLPTRHSLFRHSRFYFSLPYCFILRCTSGCPRRCRWRRTAEDMLQLTRTRRDNWGCPGCNRARQDWECSVRE
jgi:hypothetical protein